MRFSVEVHQQGSVDMVQGDKDQYQVNQGICFKDLLQVIGGFQKIRGKVEEWDHSSLSVEGADLDGPH